MKLRIPVTGGIVDVAEEKVAKYLAKGFQLIEEPKKETPKKKATKKAKKDAEEA